MRRRLPPEPVVVIPPGDYLDAKSARAYAQQKAAAEDRMAAFDAAPPEMRRVWDAVSDAGLARFLLERGVRDSATAERVLRAMGRRR